MDSRTIQRVGKSVLSAEVASRHTDPRFYGSLAILPNPDPILRKAGFADDTYDAIESDAHVMGELRSIRGGLLSYKIRAVDGVEGKASGKDLAAWELCQELLKRQPAPNMTWGDVVWNMAKGVFFGYRVHELVWERVGQYILPVKVLDKPNRRFRFDIDNNLRLLTRDNPVEGDVVEPYKFILTRHMPSHENPYGKALFSSCFWPYTFKHGGWKFFYKYCERHGLPWPIGRYPQGTKPNEQKELLDALLQLLEDGVAAVPDGDKVELLTVSHSGELAQESLIHLCNREMSKALTSQTLATEMRQVGSNAASQTHDERQGRVQESDRNIIAASFDEIFRWITVFNFGEDVAAPRFEFFKPKDFAKERAEIWEIATRIGRPSLAAFHEEANIPQAASDDDRMAASPAKPTPPPTPPGADFSAPHCKHCGGHHDFSAVDDSHLVDTAVAEFDKAVESAWLQPAYEMLKRFEADGKSLADFKAELPKLFGQLDDDAVVDIVDQVMGLAAFQGMGDA
jgi:phage gp29-like protein